MDSITSGSELELGTTASVSDKVRHVVEIYHATWWKYITPRGGNILRHVVEIYHATWWIYITPRGGNISRHVVEIYHATWWKYITPRGGNISRQLLNYHAINLIILLTKLTVAQTEVIIESAGYIFWQLLQLLR